MVKKAKFSSNKLTQNLRSLRRQNEIIDAETDFKNEGKMDNEMLRTAVFDLLSELRITPFDLSIMAKGKSPDYPGVLRDDNQHESNCKVQLSMVVASKLQTALEY